MRQTIDGAAFILMMTNAATAVDSHKQQINELNVFPVPDGDTGTNMSLTLAAAAADLRKAEASIPVSRAAEITAGALLRGARGNSGVITSLLFRGISKCLKGKTEADGYDFACALYEGVEAAYKAIMKPTEGTILTVTRVAASHAMDISLENPCAEQVLEESIKAANLALAQTIEQNPVLKKAGVVDAGGKGFVYILEGMLAGLRGEVLTAGETAEASAPKEQANFSEFDTGDIRFSYCTEFIVSRDNDSDPEALRTFLSEMGDSLVLVDDDEIIKVHVHTNNPGVALEKALTYGALQTVKIENMRLQHTEKVLSESEIAAAQTEAAPPEPAEPSKRYGVVAVCAGDGLASVFRDLGVDGTIRGGQTMNPSTDDILKEINHTSAEIVFVLPNNKNIVMAAQQAIPLTDKRVIVIPTGTVPQGISAMLAMDPDAEPEEIEAAMNEARTHVSTMQMTYAARNSDFDGFDIHEGDYIALKDGTLLGTNPDMDALLRVMAGKAAELHAEFVTIFYGEDISEEKAQAAAKLFGECCPGTDVNLLYGGQPVYYYLISAE